MAKIMDEVDKLNEDPGNVDHSEGVIAKNNAKYKAKSPEEWAVRLPVPRGLTQQAREALRKFALLDGESGSKTGQSPPSSALGKPSDQPAEKLFDENVTRGSLTQEEFEALDWELNRRILAKYRFEPSAVLGALTMAAGTAIPSDRLRDELRMNAVFSHQLGWPSSLYVNITHKKDDPVLTFQFAFGGAKAMLSGQAGEGKPIALNFKGNERINAVRIGMARQMIAYIRLTTTNGDTEEVGDARTLKESIKDFKVPSSCSGLAFFVVTKRDENTGAVGRLMLAWK